MKPNLSVFMLLIRHTAYKLLLLLAVLAAAEWAVFAVLCPEPLLYSLEEALYLCRVPLLVLTAVGFAVYSLILLASVTGRGKDRPAYTLDRLSVSAKNLIFLHSVYNTLAFLLFWSVQALVLLAMSQIYVYHGGTLGPQTLFLACWRNDLLHAFLPLEDNFRWVRNLIAAAGLGITYACHTRARQHGANSGAFAGMLVATYLLFVQPLGSTAADVGLCLVAALCSGVALYMEHARKEVDTDEAETA